MKKLFYIGALSVLLLTACGGEDTAPKEETPVEDKKPIKEESTIDKVVKSVTKNEFEVKSNEGIVLITIQDKNIHEGSKSQLVKDSTEIFAGLSKLDEVTSATIKWHAPITDQYGNEKMDEVLAIMLDGDTFKKINWDNYKSLDIEAIAPGFKQHDALKD